LNSQFGRGRQRTELRIENWELRIGAGSGGSLRRPLAWSRYVFTRRPLAFTLFTPFTCRTLATMASRSDDESTSPVSVTLPPWVTSTPRSNVLPGTAAAIAE